MGYGEFGGDGSVQWKTDVDNARPGSPKSNPKGGGKGHLQQGIDEDGVAKAGHQFKIELRPPGDGPAAAFRDLIKSSKLVVDQANNRVVLYLPIEDDTPGQIRVSWPTESQVVERDEASGKVTY